MTSDTATDVADLSFEQARDELVRVVAELEQGAPTLEQSLALWTRGEASPRGARSGCSARSDFSMPPARGRGLVMASASHRRGTRPSRDARRDRRPQGGRVAGLPPEQDVPQPGGCPPRHDGRRRRGLLRRAPRFASRPRGSGRGRSRAERVGIHRPSPPGSCRSRELARQLGAAGGLDVASRVRAAKRIRARGAGRRRRRRMGDEGAGRFRPSGTVTIDGITWDEYTIPPPPAPTRSRTPSRRRQAPTRC
jgi:exodeoxyribonuclease VII small subunit